MYPRRHLLKLLKCRYPSDLASLELQRRGKLAGMLSETPSIVSSISDAIAQTISGTMVPSRCRINLINQIVIILTCYNLDNLILAAASREL